MDILILVTYIIDINYWITGIIWHLKSAQVWIFAGSDFSCKFWNEICLKSGDIWIIWHIFESGQISTVYTHTRLTALFLGLPGWAGTRKVKTNLDFTETRDSEWQWHQLGICKSASRSRQITTPAPHHSVFYRPDALAAAQPTASKHWRQCTYIYIHTYKFI